MSCIYYFHVPFLETVIVCVHSIKLNSLFQTLIDRIDIEMLKNSSRKKKCPDKKQLFVEFKIFTRELSTFISRLHILNRKVQNKNVIPVQNASLFGNENMC